MLLDPAHEESFLQLTPENRAELGRHPSRTAPARDDPRSADTLLYAKELAEDVARSVDDDRRLIEACMSYLATDEQLFMYLEELPMVLDHLDELSVRRAQGVWPEVPMVILTATRGRPAEWIPKVIAVQDEVVAAANGQQVVVPDSGHYVQIDRPDLVVQWARQVGS